MTFPPREGYPKGPDALADMCGQRPSRFRRKTQTNKPIRPVTAYDVFFRNTYPWVKGRRPDLSQQQIFIECGRMWRETTTWEDRQICYDYADWEKEKYDKEMKRWRNKRYKLLESLRSTRGSIRDLFTPKEDGLLDEFTSSTE